MRNCDKCSAELTPVFNDRNRRSTDDPQYEDALIVKIAGGYSMFIDDYVAPFVICKNCAQELIDQNPWLITPEIDHLSKETVDEE